jgi:hypothetical protein
MCLSEETSHLTSEVDICGGFILLLVLCIHIISETYCAKPTELSQVLEKYWIT